MLDNHFCSYFNLYENVVLNFVFVFFKEMPWRGAGVAIPMFSVRSEEDVGVGEFLDLKLVVDWSVDSGFHLLQLLPINDTSVHKMWWDSYPYRQEYYTKVTFSLFMIIYYLAIVFIFFIHLFLAMQFSLCICLAPAIPQTPGTFKKYTR